MKNLLFAFAISLLGNACFFAFNVDKSNDKEFEDLIGKTHLLTRTMDLVLRDSNDSGIEFKQNSLSYGTYGDGLQKIILRPGTKIIVDKVMGCYDAGYYDYYSLGRVFIGEKFYEFEFYKGMKYENRKLKEIPMKREMKETE